MLLFKKIIFTNYICKYSASNFLRKKTYTKQNTKTFTENLGKYNFENLSIQQPYIHFIKLTDLSKPPTKSQFIEIYDTYAGLNHVQIFNRNNIKKSMFYNNLCDHIMKHNLLDIQFHRIAKLQQMSSINQLNLNNFLQDICNCIIGKLNHHKYLRKPLNNQQIYNIYKIIQRIKPFICLIPDQQIQICSILLRLYLFCRDHNIQKLELFNQQKDAISILLDKIINCNQQMSNQSFTFFIYFCQRVGVYNISIDQQKPVWKYILNNLSRYMTSNLENTNQILISLGRQYYINNQVVKYFQSALQDFENSQFTNIQTKHILKIIQGSMKLKILKKQNYLNKYKNISRHILKQLLSDQLINLMSYFLILEIWDLNVWNHFFDMYNKMSSRQIINQDIKIKQIIFALELFKDQIPKQIYSIYQNNLYKNRKLKKIKEMPMHKIRNQFNSKNQQTFIQTQLKKLFYHAKIQSFLEYQVQIFIIDIYIPKYKLIIELHGPDHYIHNLDTQELIDNLNTTFKRKILNRLGYNYDEHIIMNQHSALGIAKKIFTKYKMI